MEKPVIEEEEDGDDNATIASLKRQLDDTEHELAIEQDQNKRLKQEYKRLSTQCMQRVDELLDERGKILDIISGCGFICKSCGRPKDASVEEYGDAEDTSCCHCGDQLPCMTWCTKDVLKCESSKHAERYVANDDLLCKNCMVNCELCGKMVCIGCIEPVRDAEEGGIHSMCRECADK